ncbi:amidohydrolase family protein [Streptomyces sp. NPDC049541]|uniref:amidohydrolase family protein n=1 Tax=unclassified Streptomyces TaxID=2593676 RepID=UPI000D1AFB73
MRNAPRSAPKREEETGEGQEHPGSQIAECGCWGEHTPEDASDGGRGEVAEGLRVREILRAGADAIKVCTTGGVASPGDDPRHAHFRDDELAMMMAEVRAAGVHATAHVASGLGEPDHGERRRQRGHQPGAVGEHQLDSLVVEVDTSVNWPSWRRAV